MSSQSENSSDVGKRGVEVERRISAGKNSKKMKKNTKRGGNIASESRTEMRKGSVLMDRISVVDSGQEISGEKNTDEKKEKTEAPSLLKKGKVPSVPCTWRTSDLNRNIKELETKVNKQKTYIKLQEETLKRNDQMVIKGSPTVIRLTRR